MNIKEFNYHRPKTVKEAAALKEKLRDSCFLAGGTFIIPLARKANSIVQNIISLKSIPELSEISLKRNTLSIGPTVNLDDLASDELVRERLPILSEAISYVSSAQIRNMATIGGNLCCGLPWVDLPIALLVLDAQIELAGSKSEASLCAAEFFQSPKLVLKNRLLKKIKIKIPNHNLQYALVRIPKTTDTDISLVSSCIAIEESKNNQKRVIFAVNFGNKFPQRLLNIENACKNKQISLKWDARLEKLVKEEISALENNQYLRDIIIVCIKRAVQRLNNEIAKDSN